MNSAEPLFNGLTMLDYLNHTLHRIEEALSSYLPSVSKSSDAACPARLAAAMRYSTLSEGKRLRPVLCLIAAEACGGNCEIALPAACALEMVHTYSLIHDDLPAMDNDDLRRGRSTCHQAFDEATAILAGDGLLTLAFEVLAREIKPAAVALHCISILAEASGVVGMVGGQMADVQAGVCGKNHSTVSHLKTLSETTKTLFTLESIHRRKTAASSERRCRLAL